MKSLLKLCLLSTVLFCACRKDAIDNVPDSPVEPSVGNYLEFQNENAFLAAIQEAKSRTPEQQHAFEKEHQFVSMKSRFNEFTKKVKEMESKKDSTGFHLMKQTFANAVYWLESEFPVPNTSDFETSTLVNTDGFVKIGGKLLKLEYNRRIELRNVTDDIVVKAINDTTFGEKKDYSIVKMKHPDIVMVNEGISAMSWPGYAWLSLTNGNPSEGNHLQNGTDWLTLQSGSRRLQAKVVSRNIRSGGLLYAYVTIEYIAWERTLLIWNFTYATDVKINGAMQIRYPVGGGLYGTYTMQYNNTSIHDWYYENQYSWTGKQIIAISEKLLNHPNPATVPYNETSNRTQDIYDYAENWRLLVNDQGPVGQNMQLDPNYHWSEFKSGSPFNPSAFLRIDAVISGATLSINF